MAYIEPNTEVKFLTNVPLDPDYENTLYFDSLAQQTNYFLSRVRRSFNQLSYQRKTRGWLRVGWVADAFGGNVIKDMYASTYMMFKNSNFENKWFYAFVDRVEYVNNNTVDVQYHIDVMQTWHFDYILNQCFIERQHVTNDNIGANTIPEELEHGPYICDRPDYQTILGETIHGGDFKYTPGIIIATTFDPNTRDYMAGRVIRGWGDMGRYFSGIWYTTYSLSLADITELNNFLEDATTDDALRDGIISMSMIPLSLVHPQGQDYSYNDILFTRPTSLGNYTPRNKKLLTNPYTFMYVTNNSGQSGEFSWENSYNIGYMEFRMWANYATTPAMLCAPVEYKIAEHVGNYDEMLTVEGFPICAWTNDAFKAWFAQNAGTIIGGGVALAASWATSLAGGGALGLVAGSGGTPAFTGKHLAGTSGAHLASQKYGYGFDDSVSAPNISGSLLGATLGAVGQLIDHARRPPQTAGNSNGSLIYQSSLMTFSFYRKYIKPEYAKIIDAFFDMYGYAVHTIGVPNRSARRCYTYVKTIGCSIHGDIPAEDITEIQNLFNKGIRFWRSSAVFGNYDPSVNNNTV